MRRAFALRWSHGSIAQLFSGRDNSLGLLRLGLATAVIFSHASILGYGAKEYGLEFSGGQVTVGNLAVYGFFVLSGILVTRSGARLPLGRFLWHRALRILPGFWVCLLFTAFVVAPALYWYVHGDLAGLGGTKGPLGFADGPLGYLRADWAVATRHYDIAGLMTYARSEGWLHNGAFNGSLWTLRYEVLCYVGVAVLAVTGILKRARRAVLLVAALFYWLVVRQASAEPFWGGASHARYLEVQQIPLMGAVTPQWLIYLGLAFSLGTIIELYRDRIPVSDPLGVAALAVFVGSLHYGWFFLVGLPALAYLLVWLAIRLPRPFRRVGARHDYSYGIYIYGFLVQQTLALIGWTRWGMAAYLGLTLLFTLLLAVASWHLVERPALRLKDLGRSAPPTAPARRSVPRSVEPDALVSAASSPASGS
ncbi:acyltransferase family protein [Streptomyces sp. NPDC053431]|uniref:acyltransferase family protein n=1 Tax=Streptomyces sp. NPDC053431 TaxID=3365703 RepID=UPI0037CE3199